MRFCGLLAIGCMPFMTLAAQDSTVVKVDSVPRRIEGAKCEGQIISNIVVITQPPFTERLPRNLEFVRRLARKLHANTRDDVIRRYLLLYVGDKCNEVQREESERILRAQPFLVDARITVVGEPSGTVRLEVQTRDEFSIVAQANAAFKSPVLSGLRLGEGNIKGEAVYAAVQWHDGGAYRDLYGFRIEDYQFPGARNILRISGTRDQRGHDYGIEMLRPYFTDLQKFGWHGKIGGTRDFTGFVRPNSESNAVAVTRTYQDIGEVFRIGAVGRLKLLGASITHETAKTDAELFQLTPFGIRPDTLPSEPVQFRIKDVTRLNLLLGFRRLNFVRVNGFDALTGVQDARVGAQIGAMVGQSLSRLSPRDHDAFVMADVYAGYGSSKSFVAMQTLSEARRDHTANIWDGVLTSGRLAWYFKPATKQLTLTEVLWSTATRVRVPYQLSFADPEGGLPGYRATREPGAHRVVVRAEQRLIIPTRYNVGDAGISWFAELGKMWAGDAPYARTSPVRGAVGIGLLAAVPPKARRMWRLDFALPVGRDPDAKFEIRFSNVDRTRTFWRDPSDIARARERTAPTSLFNWP